MDYSDHKLSNAVGLYKDKISQTVTVILALLLCEISNSHAQSTNKNVELPSVQITAPNASSAESSGVKADIVLQGDRLRRKRETNLGDTLSHELGVTSSSFGPGAGRPAARRRHHPARGRPGPGRRCRLPAAHGRR